MAGSASIILCIKDKIPNEIELKRLLFQFSTLIHPEIALQLNPSVIRAVVVFMVVIILK